MDTESLQREVKFSGLLGERWTRWVEFFGINEIFNLSNRIFAPISKENISSWWKESWNWHSSKPVSIWTIWLIIHLWIYKLFTHLAEFQIPSISYAKVFELFLCLNFSADFGQIQMSSILILLSSLINCFGPQISWELGDLERMTWRIWNRYSNLVVRYNLCPKKASINTNCTGHYFHH